MTTMTHHTLDLESAMTLAEEALDLLDDLNGVELDERPEARSEPFNGLSKAQSRELRLKNSRDLQLAAHKLQLASELVRDQWWRARVE